jgi:hypothetical protein
MYESMSETLIEIPLAPMGVLAQGSAYT